MAVRKNNDSEGWHHASPYQKETMGMVWQSLDHTWPICGNDMRRPSNDMELMWGVNLAICMLWEIYGKNS